MYCTVYSVQCTSPAWDWIHTYLTIHQLLVIDNKGNDWLTVRVMAVPHSHLYNKAPICEHQCESNSLACHTRRHLHFPRVIFSNTNVKSRKTLFLKKQSKKIFNLHFFHHSNQPRPLTNGLNYFRFWLCFRRVIQILWISLGYHTLAAILLRVSYCTDSISPESFVKICVAVSRGIIPWRVNLPWVS